MHWAPRATVRLSELQIQLIHEADLAFSAKLLLPGMLPPVHWPHSEVPARGEKASREDGRGDEKLDKRAQSVRDCFKRWMAEGGRGVQGKWLWEWESVRGEKAGGKMRVESYWGWWWCFFWNNDARLYFTGGVSKHTPCETDHIRADKRRGAERGSAALWRWRQRSRSSGGAEAVMTPISNSEITLLWGRAEDF